MKTLHTHLVSLAIAGAFAVAAPAFADRAATSPNLGTPVHDESADRTIVLDDLHQPAAAARTPKVNRPGLCAVRRSEVDAGRYSWASSSAIFRSSWWTRVLRS